MRQRDLQVLHGIPETRGGFTHREHFELAWNYLRLYSVDDAAEITAAAIKQVAHLHGAKDQYHLRPRGHGCTLWPSTSSGGERIASRGSQTATLIFSIAS
jgi:hypothetical protein